MENFNTVPDYGLSWLEASGDHADIVLSTRVRLARNLQGHAFGPRARVNDREAVLRRFKESSARSETLGHGTFLELPEVETRTRRILLERRLVTRELMGDAERGPHVGAAVLLAPSDPLLCYAMGEYLARQEKWLGPLLGA